MPLFHYLCSGNHSVKKFYRQAKDAPVVLLCEKCDKESKKMLSAPNSASTIIIDNGFQARSVEVNLDIIADNQARNEKVEE